MVEIWPLKSRGCFPLRYKQEFVKDLSLMRLNEGWTVTYWSLQVLSYLAILSGCLYWPILSGLRLVGTASARR